MPFNEFPSLLESFFGKLSPAYLNASEQIMAAMPEQGATSYTIISIHIINPKKKIFHSIGIGSAQISDWANIITPIIKLYTTLDEQAFIIMGNFVRLWLRAVQSSESASSEIEIRNKGHEIMRTKTNK